MGSVEKSQTGDEMGEEAGYLNESAISPFGTRR